MFSDYSLRVLMYVGSKEDGSLSTIDDIAGAYRVSRNHLMKVVLRLGQLGYLETVRGKGGGIRLGRPPDRINIGSVVRETEEDLGLVECMQDNGALCAIDPACVLRGALRRALNEFFRVLDEYSLQDLLAPRNRLISLLGIAS
jgi:Rrf2 family nitric oxide-sensitive transcriptional repressor